MEQPRAVGVFFLLLLLSCLVVARRRHSRRSSCCGLAQAKAVTLFKHMQPLKHVVLEDQQLVLLGCIPGRW
jgi:hypothetical protein